MDRFKKQRGLKLAGNAELLQTIPRDAKHIFERVRMPLAKMATANRYKADSPIAYPALNMRHGIAWQVREDVFITRFELSETFLSFLEGL